MKNLVFAAVLAGTATGQAAAATCEQTLDQVKAGNLRISLIMRLENTQNPADASMMELNFRVLSSKNDELKCEVSSVCGNKRGIYVSSGLLAERQLQTWTAGHEMALCPEEDSDPGHFQGTLVDTEKVWAPRDWIGVLAADLGLEEFKPARTGPFVPPLPAIAKYPGWSETSVVWGTGRPLGSNDIYRISVDSQTTSIRGDN